MLLACIFGGNWQRKNTCGAECWALLPSSGSDEAQSRAIGILSQQVRDRPIRWRSLMDSL